MKLSNLINYLIAIRDACGEDVETEISYDKRYSDRINLDEGVCIDTLKLIKVDKNIVYLTNEYFYSEEYRGYTCEVFYDTEDKIYKGNVKLDTIIEGVNTSFETKNRYEVSNVYHATVDKIIEYINAKNVYKTFKAVNNILNPDIYEPSDDDDEYSG